MTEKINIPTEVWKTLVQGGKVWNRYQVSNYGKVWDNKNEAEVAQNLTGEPAYLYVNLVDDEGIRYGRRVNNIVSWTFQGKPPTPKHTSDHIDRDKLNNVEWNLRWADKRPQMLNREGTITMKCGTSVVEYVSDLGYDLSTAHKIGSYLVNRLRLGDTLTEAYFSWANCINPFPKKWRERSLDIGQEYKGV